MFEGRAVGGQHAALDVGAVARVVCDEAEADWLFGRTWARAGDAGEGDGVVCAGAREASGGHGGGDLVADGAVSGDEIRGDAELSGFLLVGVDYGGAEEDGGGTGDAGDPVGHVAAGAGLGRGDAGASGGCESDDDILEGIIAGAVDGIAEFVGGECPGTGDGVGILAEEAEIDFAWARAVADLDMGETGEQGGLDAFLKVGFGNTDGAEDADGEGGAAECSEAGQDEGLEHGIEFARWAREQEDVPGGSRARIVREVQARGRAMLIGEDFGALRDHGLDPDAVRWREAAAGEALSDALEDGGVVVELAPEKLCGGVAGDVIGGGAEPAGDDNDGGTGHGLGEGDADVGPIGDRCLSRNAEPALGEASAKISGVGIERLAEEEFGAGI